METCPNYHCHHCRQSVMNSRVNWGVAWGKGWCSYSHSSINALQIIQINVDISYMKMMACLPTQHNFRTSFPISFVIGDPKLLDIDILRWHNSSNFSGLLLSSTASAFAPLVSPSLFHQLYSPVMSLTHQFRLQSPPVLDCPLYSLCGFCHRDTFVHPACRGWQAALGLTRAQPAQVSLVPTCPGWGML